MRKERIRSARHHPGILFTVLAFVCILFGLTGCQSASLCSRLGGNVCGEGIRTDCGCFELAQTVGGIEGGVHDVKDTDPKVAIRILPDKTFEFYVDDTLRAKTVYTLVRDSINWRAEQRYTIILEKQVLEYSMMYDGFSTIWLAQEGVADAMGFIFLRRN